MSGESTCWKIEGDVARLTCGPLSARMLLDRTSGGLGELEWQQQEIPFSLGAFMMSCGANHPGCRRIETYIRGNDLVSNYESDSPSGTPQIYWRVRHHAAHSAVGVELILSKNTPLLDSDPMSAVDCTGPEFWYAPQIQATAFRKFTSSDSSVRLDRSSTNTHLFLFRLERLQISYLQMVHPSDFAFAKLINQLAEFGGERWYAKSFVFPEPLEKGVIRRARIGGWFMPSENDLAVAVELARQFIDEPLPLTT